MRPISSLIVPSAVVVVVVVSATAISAGVGQAQAADDCLAAPNAASPAGQHWYYRIDRVKQRKCWYLHAPLGIAHQAHGESARAHDEIEHPAAAAPAPVAAAPWPAVAAPLPAVAAPLPAANAPAAASGPAADGASSVPQATVLTVKTIPVRPHGARADRQTSDGAGGASISQAQAGAYTAAQERKSDSTTFFFLVFGLGLMTFLMAIVVKRVAPQARWLLWPIRTEADMAWPQERSRYSSDGPTWLDSRAAFGSRRMDRRVTRRYDDEITEPEYERA